MVFRLHSERAEPVQRTPNRESEENANRGGRFALCEAEGRPNHNRHTNESDRIVVQGNGKPSAKDDLSENNQQEQEAAGFNCLHAIPAPLRGSDTPQKNERSDNQIARGIAQPPRCPDCPIMRPVSKTSERETGNTETGADCCTDNGGQRELKNILWPIENACAARKMVHQPGTANRLQRVARRDAKRRKNIAGRR